jgi:hypothetical protein
MEKFQDIMHTKPEGFLRDSVRNRTVEGVEKQEFKNLLDACSAVENLNLLVVSWDPDVLALDSSLRRLSCFSAPLFGTREMEPVLGLSHT